MSAFEFTSSNLVFPAIDGMRLANIPVTLSSISSDESRFAAKLQNKVHVFVAGFNPVP